MASLPQELIDETIDNLPRSSMYSCSLVARGWRRRSQTHIFAFVTFSSECDLVLWRTKIPQGPGGIPSYVRFARFQDISSWREPVLFGRVLKKLTSLAGLVIVNTKIPRPYELPGSVSLGEFGKGVESLVISSPRCTVATLASFILSFPNLETFLFVGEVSKKRPPTMLRRASQRRPLESLGLFEIRGEVGIALARYGLTSRKLSLNVRDAGLEQLLTVSSEVIVELELSGTWPLETLRRQKQY